MSGECWMMAVKRIQEWLWGFFVVGLILLLLTGFSPPYQELPSLITLAVDAGFDGNFRENQWLPVYVQAANDGADVEGSLVVRPATSDNGVTNTYSVPISLPQGSRKAVFLYITANSFANQIRVELINNDGIVVAAEGANLRSIQARDQLFVVVSGSAVGTVDLTGVHDAGYAGYQATWTVSNIPDHPSSLESVNLLLFSDIDTGTLSTAQRTAITEWVTQGGHLVVTGGTNWQATAAGLADLLPLSPSSSQTVDDLTPLSDWLRIGDSLSGQSVIAAGAVEPGAQVLVSAGEFPLLIRRTLGNGTIDYLAADPNTQPLRGWSGLTDLWLTLASTTDAQPSWSHGINDWSAATTSVNILPGVNLLPDILPLCGFLAVYIALIGPLNYFVLNRLNRRELAWLTIPLLIIVFSALAWVVGFNLRGNEVTVSRLTLVQSWPDSDSAHVQQLLGLLSPRRSQYSLSVSDGSFLRPVPQAGQSSFLSSNIQASTNIQQSEIFQAVDFPVDASFIAAFNADAVIEKPAVSGRATMAYEGVEGAQVMRGSVRNDTDYTLQNPVILVRGQSYHLSEPLEPGGVADFDITLSGEGIATPSSIASAAGAFTSVFSRTYQYQVGANQTVKDVMGENLFQGRSYFSLPGTASPEQQEFYRRQVFLSSFVYEPYEDATGRGDAAYLAAWTDHVPLDMTLEGANWKSVDTTLYLIQLEVEHIVPTQLTRIAPDRYTWFVAERAGLTDVGPGTLSLQPGDEVVFRFTPLPDAVLKQVTELSVIMDRGSSSRRNIPIGLWDWEAEDWEVIDVTAGDIYAIRNPARFLGPQNMVQVRLTADSIGTYSRFQDLAVEQRGRF
jgi:hypothetical protein